MNEEELQAAAEAEKQAKRYKVTGIRKTHGPDKAAAVKHVEDHDGDCLAITEVGYGTWIEEVIRFDNREIGDQARELFMKEMAA